MFGAVTSILSTGYFMPSKTCRLVGDDGRRCAWPSTAAALHDARSWPAASAALHPADEHIFGLDLLAIFAHFS